MGGRSIACLNCRDRNVLGLRRDLLTSAAYGVDQDTLDLRRLTHTYQGTWPAVRVGTALQHVAHAAEDFGLSSYGLYDDGETFHQWTVDEVAAQKDAAALTLATSADTPYTPKRLASCATGNVVAWL